MFSLFTFKYVLIAHIIPECNGFDAIMTIVDRLSKRVRYIATRSNIDYFSLLILAQWVYYMIYLCIYFVFLF